MKVGTSTKVIISVVGIFVAAFIGFKATQQPPAVGPTKAITKAITEQQTADSTVERKHVPETDARPSDVKADAQTEVDEVSEKDANDFLAWLDELEENSTVEDMDDEETEEADERALAEERLLQRRLAEAAESVTKIPLLVDEWKELKAQSDNIDSVYGVAYSEEKASELMRLQRERDEIANEVASRAGTYDHVHPEEGVIDYPNGWMGRAAMEVGVAINNWSPAYRANPAYYEAMANAAN